MRFGHSRPSSAPLLTPQTRPKAEGLSSVLEAPPVKRPEVLLPPPVLALEHELDDLFKELRGLEVEMDYTPYTRLPALQSRIAKVKERIREICKVLGR